MCTSTETMSSLEHDFASGLPFDSDVGSSTDMNTPTATVIDILPIISGDEDEKSSDWGNWSSHKTKVQLSGEKRRESFRRIRRIASMDRESKDKKQTAHLHFKPILASDMPMRSKSNYFSKYQKEQPFKLIDLGLQTVGSWNNTTVERPKSILFPCHDKPNIDVTQNYYGHDDDDDEEANDSSEDKYYWEGMQCSPHRSVFFGSPTYSYAKLQQQQQEQSESLKLFSSLSKQEIKNLIAGENGSLTQQNVHN